jgi:hypothetical protein
VKEGLQSASGEGLKGQLELLGEVVKLAKELD